MSNGVARTDSPCAPIWSGRIPPPATLGGLPITPEMIRETEEELGLREIIDAGISALYEGNVSQWIAEAVVTASDASGISDGQLKISE